MATVNFLDRRARSYLTPEQNAPQSSAGPVEQQPYAPQPAAPDAPHTQNAAGRGVSPEQYYRDYLKNFNVNLRQSQAGGWDELTKAMNDEGFNVSLDSRADGMHKGLYMNRDPNQFVKILDGYDKPIWMPGGNEAGGGGGKAGGSGDPSSELWMNELLTRMEQLRKPVEDPLAPLYQLMAMQRIQGLQGDPYTKGDDAALTARYMNPLTQARDQELQQNKERVGARGMLPSSGLLDELNKGTGANYQQGVATHSNDLAVRAVDERQRRQQEQLSVLSQVLGFNRTSRNEENDRAGELIDLASQFPAFDERRLGQLLQASGDGGAANSATNTLMTQRSQALQRELQRANNQAERDAAYGEFFGSILNNWDDIF